MTHNTAAPTTSESLAFKPPKTTPPAIPRHPRKPPRNPEHVKPIVARVMAELEEDPSDALKFAVSDPNIFPEISE